MASTLSPAITASVRPHACVLPPSGPPPSLSCPSLPLFFHCLFPFALAHSSSFPSALSSPLPRSLSPASSNLPRCQRLSLSSSRFSLSLPLPTLVFALLLSPVPPRPCLASLHPSFLLLPCLSSWWWRLWQRQSARYTVLQERLKCIHLIFSFFLSSVWVNLIPILTLCYGVYLVRILVVLGRNLRYFLVVDHKSFNYIHRAYSTWCLCSFTQRCVPYSSPAFSYVLVCLTTI